MIVYTLHVETHDGYHSFGGEVFYAGIDVDEAIAAGNAQERGLAALTIVLEAWVDGKVVRGATLERKIADGSERVWHWYINPEIQQ